MLPETGREVRILAQRIVFAREKLFEVRFHVFRRMHDNRPGDQITQPLRAPVEQAGSRCAPPTR